jgi:phosphomannomutase
MMKLDKKIVAFDLDGTLAESKQHLEPYMAEILCELAKEKKVAVITGGSFGQFQKQFLPFLNSANTLDDEIISNFILLPTSGSSRYEYNKKTKEWNMTDIEEFPKDIKIKVIEELNNLVAEHKYGIGAVISGDDIVEDRVTQITLSALGQHAPIDKKNLWDPDQKIRQIIKKELEKKLPRVNIVIGGTTSIDILPYGFNKAKGLNRLLRNMNLTINDMVFLGDAIFPGGNDYSVYEAGIESIKVSGPKETADIIKKWF